MKPGLHRACRLLRAAAAALCACAPLLAAQAPSVAELTRRGAAHLEKKEYARALRQFQAAAKIRPGDAAIQFNIGLALYGMGRYREALTPLAKALAHPPSANQARYLRGVIFFESREFDACARELEGLRADTRFGEHALYMLEESYRNLSDARRSREAFLELGTRYPESAYLHKLMGMAHEWANDDSKAIAEFKEALRVNPLLPEAAFAIGYIYFKQGNHEEARAWFGKELQTDPRSAKAHHYLGEMEYARENWDEAAARYRKAIECDARFPEPWVGLGSVFEQKGELGEAIQAFREAVRLNPKDSRARFKLGLALRRAGRTEEGDAEFAVAQELIRQEQSRKAR